VIGAGIIGAACAYFLASAGLRVHVIDARGWAAGASGAGQGALVAWDHATAASRRMSREGIGMWAQLAPELATETGVDIEHRSVGSLVAVVDENLLAEGEARCTALDSQGISVRWLDCRAVHECEPLVAPSVGGGLYFPADGLLEPRLATVALLRAAQRRGATCTLYEPVRAMQESHASVVVSTDARSCTADLVILAAALETPWLAGLLGFSLPIRAVKGHVAVVVETDLRIGRFVSEYLPDRRPDAGGSGPTLWSSVQPTAAGPVLVGGSRETGDNLDRSVDIDLACSLPARAATLIPWLTRSILLRVYAGLRPASIDGTPFVGHLPGHPRVLVAAGHGGAGIMMAPATGKLIAELALGIPATLPVELYAPGRAEIAT